MANYAVLLLLAVSAQTQSADALDRLDGMMHVAGRIDRFAQQHWHAVGVKPARIAQDATFLRRVTLDLAGRIPTAAEARSFAADSSPEKRQRVIRALVASPAYPLHMGNVFDGIIQAKHSGDPEFVVYLRRSFQEHKPWDVLFREILVGPWDSDNRKPASQFLAKRLRSLDTMTRDTTRVFFGVDIMCAKCHDHPLVDDWTQDNYYGMASFFNRTYEFGKRNSGIIAEKANGNVNFVTVDGERRSASVMFLSNQVVEDPPVPEQQDNPVPEQQDNKEKKRQKDTYVPPPFSRREQLVEVALQERNFFSKAIVNHLWAYLLGRGLAHPTDQMHSENPPSIPGLLEWLAEDLAQNGYDLERMTAAIVSSRLYQRSSQWEGDGQRPGEADFALALLRPLTRRQLAFSLLLATGNEPDDQMGEERRYLEIERNQAPLIEYLDARTDNFQSSTTESLFMSNSPVIQKLVRADCDNLAARLVQIDQTAQLVETAVWTVLSRPPDSQELSALVRFVNENQLDRQRACSQLIWALVTSGEFRFNH